MQRFMIFVDGSNLHGSLKSMNLEVDDYEAFFAYLHRESCATWLSTTLVNPTVATQLRRVYWYVVGSIDKWDLSLPQSQSALRNAFESNRDIRNQWMSSTGKAFGGLAGEKLAEKAWIECFSDFKNWYEHKHEVLAGMRRFYQGVRINTDLIDVVESGHWKVNFIHKWVEEKGLDTSLAVHMLAYIENYDVGLVVSGDADSIPSIQYVKSRDKQVGAVEFVNGSPPEAKGRGFSSRLKEHADFVVRIYETELVRHGLARRPAPRTP